MGTGRILFGSAAFSSCACFFVCLFRYLLASLLDAIEVNSQVQFVKIPEGIEIVSGPCIVVAKCRRKSGIYLFSGCHTHACCFADAVGLFEATGIVRNLASLLV